MRYPVLEQCLRYTRELSPNAIKSVVDIGAQRKTDFLMQVFPDCYHHLFEPVSVYHDELVENYSLVGIEHTLHKVALGNTDGKLFLHNQSMDRSGNVTHSQIKPAADETMTDLVNIEQIDTRRLDSVLSRKELGDLSYIVKMDVDGVEEQIIEGGPDVIGGASFVIIECSIGRQDLLSRAAALEKLGFRIYDICDLCYYYGQLAIVDLVMINNRLRNAEPKFKPWQYGSRGLKWKKWQSGLPHLRNQYYKNPFED